MRCDNCYVADVKVNFLEKEKPAKGLPGEEKPKRAPIKIPLWAIILAVSQIAIFSVAGVVFKNMLSAQKEAQKPKPKVEAVAGNFVFAFDPIKTNLMSSTSVIKVLNVTLAFETDNKRVHSELQQNASQTRDELIMLLSSKSPDEVNSVKKIEDLRAEIITKVNHLLTVGTVKNLYLTNFIIKERDPEAEDELNGTAESER